MAEPGYWLKLPPVGEWGWWRSTLPPAQSWRDRAGTRQAMRATLTEVQGGLCGLCLRPAGERSVLDHDHVTGLARAMLCRGCNSHEGYGWPGPTLRAYRDSPPAAGAGWMWDLTGVSRAAWKLVGYADELVIPDRLLSLVPVVTRIVREHEDRLARQALAVMRARAWEEPGRNSPVPAATPEPEPVTGPEPAPPKRKRQRHVPVTDEEAIAALIAADLPELTW